MALSSITNVLLYLTADSSKAQVELNKTFKGIERHSDNLNTKLGKITERQDIIVDSSKKVRKAIEDIANVKIEHLKDKIFDTKIALKEETTQVGKLVVELGDLKNKTDEVLKDNQKYKDRKKSIDDLTDSIKKQKQALEEQIKTNDRIVKEALRITAYDPSVSISKAFAQAEGSQIYADRVESVNRLKAKLDELNKKYSELSEKEYSVSNDFKRLTNDTESHKSSIGKLSALLEEGLMPDYIKLIELGNKLKSVRQSEINMTTMQVSATEKLKKEENDLIKSVERRLEIENKLKDLSKGTQTSAKKQEISELKNEQLGLNKLIDDQNNALQVTRTNLENINKSLKAERAELRALEKEHKASRKDITIAVKDSEYKNLSQLKTEYNEIIKQIGYYKNKLEEAKVKQQAFAGDIENIKSEKMLLMNEEIRQAVYNLDKAKNKLKEFENTRMDKVLQEQTKFEEKIKNTEYNLTKAKAELQSFINTKIDKKSQEFENAQKKVDGLKQSLERLKAKGKEVEKAKESGIVRVDEKEAQKLNQLNTQLSATKKHIEDLNARKIDLTDAQDQRNKINIVSGALFALSNVMYSLIGYTRQLGQEITKAFEGFKTLDADVLQLRALEQVSGDINNLLAGQRKPAEEYSVIAKEMIELGNAYGLTADDVGKSHKKIVQFGLESAEATELFKSAQYTAIATQADFNKIVDAGLRIHTNYKVAIKDLPSYFNLMAVTAGRSSISMEDFSSRIGELSAVAAPLKIDFGELITLFGSSAKSSKDSAQATVSMVNYLTKLQKPYKETKEVIDKLNQAFNLTGKNRIQFNKEGIENAGGIIKFTQKLSDMLGKVKNSSEVMNKLFPEIRAMRGFQFLLNDVQNLGKELEFASKETGYLSNSFNEMSQSLEFRFKNLGSKIKNYFIQIFSDYRKLIVDSINEIIKGLNFVIPTIVNTFAGLKDLFPNTEVKDFIEAVKLLTLTISNLALMVQYTFGIVAFQFEKLMAIIADIPASIKAGVIALDPRNWFNGEMSGKLAGIPSVLDEVFKQEDEFEKRFGKRFQENANRFVNTSDIGVKHLESQIKTTETLLSNAITKRNELLLPKRGALFSIADPKRLKEQQKLIKGLENDLNNLKEKQKKYNPFSNHKIPSLNIKQYESTLSEEKTGKTVIPLTDDKNANKAYNNAKSSLDNKSSLDKLMRAIEDRYSSEKELAKERFELESQTSNDISKLQDDYSKKQKAIENQRINDYLALQQGKYEKISVLMGNTRKNQLASFNKEKSLINSILKTETDKIEEIDKRQKGSKENKANLDKQDFERHKQESSERIKIEIARLDLMYKFDKQSLNSKLKNLGEKQSKELADFDLMEKKDKNFQAKRVNLIQKHANEKADVIEQERLNDINLAEQRYDIELSGKMKTFALLNEEAEMRAFYAKERVKNEKDSADKIAKIENDLKLKKQELWFENLDLYFKSAEQFGQAMANSTSETAKNMGGFVQIAGQAGSKITNLTKDIVNGNFAGIVQTAVVEIGNSIARIIENFEELNSLINSGKASFQDFAEVGVKGFKAIPIVGDLVYSVMRGVTDIIGLTMRESEKEARKKLADLQKEYGKFLTELKTRNLQEKRDQLQREKDEEIKALNATKGLRVSEALLKRAEIEDRYKEIHSLDKQIAEAEKDSSNEVMMTRLKNQKKTFAQRVQLIKRQAIIDGDNASKSYANETELSNKLDVIKMNSINEMTEVKKEALQFELDFIKDIWSEQLQFHNDKLKQIEREKQAELDAITAVDDLRRERELEQRRKKGAGEEFTKSLKSAKYGEDFFRKTEEEFQTWLEDEQGKIDTAYNVTGEMNKEQFMKANRELAIQSASYLQRRLTGTPDAPTAAKLLTEQNQLENQKETLKSLLETAKKTKDTLKQEEIKNNLELLSASILNLKQLREGNKLLKGKSETTKKLQQAQMLFLENSYDLEMEKAVEQDNETRENAKTLGELAEKEKRNIEDIKDKKAEAEAEVRKEYLKSGDEWLNGMDSRLNTFINSAKTYFTTDIQNSINQLNFSGVGKSFETIKGYFNESIDQANNVLKKISELGIKNKEQVPTSQTGSGSGYTETTLPSGESYGVGGSGSPYSRENMLLESAMQHPKWKTDKVGALIESGASYDEAIKLSGGTDSYKQSKTTSPFGSITPNLNNPFYVPPTNKQTEVDKWIEQANKIALGQFGDGGVIDKPTFALMGERGAETVFNADQMRNLHSMIAGYRGGGNSSNTSINIVFSGQINANNQSDINAIADKVSKVITKQFVRQI